MNKKFILCIICILITSNLLLSQNINNRKLTNQQWSSDIDTLITRMAKVHINPYHKTSKEDFDAYAARFKSKLSSMTDNQILVEFLKMTAMIGDGHTVFSISGMHVPDDSQKSIFDLHSYPLQPYLFNEGVYVIYSNEKNKDLVGMKLVKINDTKIETIIEKMKLLVPRDNDYTVKFALPFYLTTAEYLNGLGLAPDDLVSKFTFEDINGKQFDKMIAPGSVTEYFQLLNQKKYPDTAPMYLQHDEKNYWFEYLEGPKILYINYKRVLIDPADSLKFFCSRLEEFINTHEIDKTIIDIRNNGGGNNATCQRFVDLITDNKKINQKGKLFTIIGRETFSAASYLTTKLEFNTNTIFVGEPTGASPNHYGDNRPLFLPNSGFNILLSSIYWQNSFPQDDRQWTEPEIKVDISAEDYFSGKDPVVEAIMNYDYPESNLSGASPELSLALTGKYLFTPLEYMEIKEEGNELMLEVRRPDFIGRDVRYIYTPVYPLSANSYTTGIKDLNISINNNTVKLSHRLYEWYAPKVDSNFKMPAEFIAEGKIPEGIAFMKEVKNKYPDNSTVSEREINNLGYILLNAKNLEAAIEVLKLNVELYPQGFNTYDSLGEAYLLAGNNELALLNYKKSLELNPQNENARKIIERLTTAK